MQKITLILKDGTEKIFSDVSRMKIYDTGLSFCMPVREWFRAYLYRHETRNLQENVELQNLVENLPSDFWSISFTPADDYGDGNWHNNYFTVTKKNDSNIVESGDLIDALRWLVND